MGPFPPDSHGYCYIIVIICCFSRYVELYAVRDTTAEEAARVVLEHTCRYGQAGEFVSDNGPEYVNDIIAELLKLLDIEHTRTLAYSKEENAIVERVNKEVLRHLRAIMYDVNVFSEWSTYRPFVARILNNEIHESTGVSPAQLIFGNSVNLSRGIIYPNKLTDDTMQLSEWTAKLLKTQSLAIQIAQKNQLAKDERHLQDADPRRTEFKIGSYVLVDYHTGLLTRTAGPTKLHTPKRGPFKVIGFSKNRYTVYNMITQRNENHFIKDLTPFEFDAEHTNVKEVANRDYQLTEVETILQHKGFASKKTQLTFLVKWKDHDDSYNSWVDWKFLKRSKLLHDYLYSHDMRTAIPPEYKPEARARHESSMGN
jgi:hypothetical protein